MFAFGSGLRLGAIAGLLVLAGCGVGNIEDLSVSSPPLHETAPPADNPGIECYRNPDVTCESVIRLGQTADVAVRGTGKCDSFTFLAGDSRPPQESGPIDFDKGPWTTTVTYPAGSTWLGRKKLWAINSRQCGGRASEIIQVMKPGFSTREEAASLSVGFPMPRATACDIAAPNHPPLRAGSVVTIRPLGANTINFGCPHGGCIWDIDGNPGSVAPAGMPFPGLRWHSLVLKIGTDLHQGGKNVSFTVQNTGILEICQNDDILGDNTGAWGFLINVDETGVATPY